MIAAITIVPVALPTVGTIAQSSPVTLEQARYNEDGVSGTGAAAGNMTTGNAKRDMNGNGGTASAGGAGEAGTVDSSGGNGSAGGAPPATGLVTRNGKNGLTHHAVGRRRLLDVGCHIGVFLELAAARGWAAQGIEPSGWACAVARDRGLDVRCSTLRDAALPAAAFDVVTMWDVIDIMIVSVVVYEVLKLIRGTHAVQMAIGIATLVGLFYISRGFQLETEPPRRIAGAQAARKFLHGAVREFFKLQSHSLVPP